VLGELQNEFPKVSKEAFEEESKRIGEGLHDAMRKHRGQHQKPTYAEREVPHRKIGEFLGNVWYDRALENSSSPERELSRMVSHFVFNTTYTLCRRVAFELSQRNAQYQKGSCRVKRISVRSARTFWVPRNGSGTEQSSAQAQSLEDLQKLQSYNDASQGDENYDSPSGVMLQIKTLYCIQRTIEPRGGVITNNAYAPEQLTAPEDEVYHCEATFEGWLHGGPEGSLQWRIIEFLDLNKDAS
jgi:hypothetical protein